MSLSKRRRRRRRRRRQRRLPPELYKRGREPDRVTHVILHFSFFLFFFSVGRSVVRSVGRLWMVELMYVRACSTRETTTTTTTTGEAKKGPNTTTNIRQHSKIDENEKKQQAREVKVE